MSYDMSLWRMSYNMALMIAYDMNLFGRSLDTNLREMSCDMALWEIRNVVKTRRIKQEQDNGKSDTSKRKRSSGMALFEMSGCRALLDMSYTKALLEVAFDTTLLEGNKDNTRYQERRVGVTRTRSQ